MKARCALLLLIAIPFLAQGSDMAINDVRLSYAPLLGRSFDVDGSIDDLETNAVGQHAAIGTLDKHRRSMVSYYRSMNVLQTRRGALLVGAEAAYDGVAGVQSGSHLDGNSQMIDVFVGWAYELGKGWHLEEGALLGCGRSQWRLRADDLVEGQDSTLDDTATAFSYEYAFRVGAYRTLKSGLQFGAEARYSVLGSQAKFAGAVDVGSDREVLMYEPDIAVHGLGFAVSLGYRF
jgi:hypothetical protein